jgi:hypothetical protein
MFERFPSVRLALLPIVATALCATAMADGGKVAPKENLTTTPPKAGTSVITVPAPSATPRVIYGADDRHDVYDETDPAILSLASSVGAVLFASDLTDNGNGTYSIATSSYSASYNLCASEPYFNQPVAATCTAFVVGTDLIATAGHCIESDGTPTVSEFRIVFGYQMEDAATPVTTIPAADVFSAVEVVSRVENGSGADYAVVRVDRPIVTASRKALPIRRTGTIADQARIGVIGHPAGLPLKIAFGGRSAVRDNSSNEYFVASLDTYGGNSGSPVFNQETLQVEGILVRGEADYYSTGSCNVSSILPETAGGEDVTRISPIQGFITDATTVYFQQRYFNCSSSAGIRVHDPNWPNENLTVTVTGAGGGDSEQVTLSDPSVVLDWAGQVQLALTDNDVAINDGTLEIDDEEAIIVTYEDNDTTAGLPGTLTDRAIIDCVAPIIDGVVLTDLGPSYFELTLGTSEPAVATLTGGATCGALTGLSTSELGVFHQAFVSELQSCQTYLVTITAVDRAGNVAVDNNSGYCHAVTTYGTFPDLLSEDFAPEGGVVGWTVDPVPDPDTSTTNNWGLRSSIHAHSGEFVYSYEPGEDFAAEASLVSPIIPPANILEFYHTYDIEESYDGAALEISTDNGQNWQDLGPFVAIGPYPRRISGDYESALADRMAWSGGTFGPMTKVLVNISSFAGAQNRIRFRFASDSGFPSVGWQIDDFRIYQTYPCPEGNQWILY